eukprot:6765764-Prymnesium_polylepis.1
MPQPARAVERRERRGARRQFAEDLIGGVRSLRSPQQHAALRTPKRGGAGMSREPRPQRVGQRHRGVDPLGHARAPPGE